MCERQIILWTSALGKLAQQPSSHGGCPEPASQRASQVAECRGLPEHVTLARRLFFTGV